MGVNFDKSNDQYFARTVGAFPDPNSFTFCCWVRASSSTSSGYRTFLTYEKDVVSAGGGRNGLSLYFNFNSHQLRWFDGRGGTFVARTIATLQPDTDYFVAVICRPGSSDAYYRAVGDTSLTAATSTLNNSNTRLAFNEFYIGYDGSSGEEHDGDVSAVKSWDAELSVAELFTESHTIRPIRQQDIFEWYPLLNSDDAIKDYGPNGFSLTESGDTAIVRADNPPLSWGGSGKLVLPAALSIITDLIAATGNYSLTGNDVDILSNRLVDALVGNYSLIGNPINTPLSTLIAANAGNYSLTGIDVALSKTFVFTADAGSFSYVGNDVDLLKDLFVQAVAGNYTLTGNDVDILNSRLVLTESGNYSLNGNDVAILNSRLLSGETGVYSLTGNDVVILFGLMLSAESGSYLLAGQDVGLVGQKILSAIAGNFSLTGNDVTISQGEILNAEIGAYSLTGLSANFQRAAIMVAESANYSLAGNDVAILNDQLLPANTGNYSLAGNDVDLPVGGFSLNAEAGNFTVNGFDTSILKTSSLNGSPGNYSLLGNDANFIYGYQIAADAGVYYHTGIDVELFNDKTLIANAGSYVLTGANVALNYSAANAFPDLEGVLTYESITPGKSFTSLTPIRTFVH